MNVYTNNDQLPLSDKKKENHFAKFPEHLLIILFLGIGFGGTLFNLNNMTYDPDKSERNAIYQQSRVVDERIANGNLARFNSDEFEQDKPILSNQLSIG